MNRSTIYEYLRNDTELVLMFKKIGRGSYPILVAPYKWDEPCLLINNMRITDFDSIVLFSNELVVRFFQYANAQINIPYKDITYFEVCEDLDVRYIGLDMGGKVHHVE